MKRKVGILWLILVTIIMMASCGNPKGLGYRPPKVVGYYTLNYVEMNDQIFKVSEMELDLRMQYDDFNVTIAADNYAEINSFSDNPIKCKWELDNEVLTLKFDDDHIIWVMTYDEEEDSMSLQVEDDAVFVFTPPE